MALVSMRELKQLKRAHYIVEILLAISFALLKIYPITSEYLFEVREFTTVETQVFVLTFIVSFFKARRWGNTDFLPYISTLCTVSKVGNFILFFINNSLYGFVYTLALIAHFLLLPKPKYKGPENITYFFGENLEKEVTQSKSTWIIEFYASWNPHCNEFAGLFSELSAKFASKELKFGKIDISRCPKIAEKYQINGSVTARQELPTLIVFINGQVHARRPTFDARGRVIPFSLSYENIVSSLSLRELSKGTVKSNAAQTKKDK